MSSLRLCLLTLVMLTSFAVFIPSIVVAEDSVEVPQYESINPGDGLKYIIKRAREKAMLFFYSISPEKKIDYSQKVLDSRLAELTKVANEKDLANIETTSSRYSSTVGVIAEAIVSKSMNQKKEVVRQQLERHSKVLSKVQTNFDPLTSEWRFIQDDINSLDIYIKKLL